MVCGVLWVNWKFLCFVVGFHAVIQCFRIGDQTMEMDKESSVYWQFKMFDEGNVIFQIFFDEKNPILLIDRLTPIKGSTVQGLILTQNSSPWTFLK